MRIVIPGGSGQLGSLLRIEALDVTSGQEPFAADCRGERMQLLQGLQGGSSPDDIRRLGIERGGAGHMGHSG